MIEIKNISKSFGEKAVLHDVSAIMMPGKKDVISPVCQDLLNSIDGIRCIGQLYPLLDYDRLSVLNGLKELEDRQFIFLERQRSGLRVIGRN